MITRPWNAKYLREVRQAAKERGLCGTCRVRQPLADKKTCEHCLGYRVKTRHGIRMGTAWCVACCAFGFHRSDCAVGVGNAVQREPMKPGGVFRG